MLLRWNGKNVWSIGTGMVDASVVQFIPGPNSLTAEQWDCIKKHPEIKLRMEQDIIDEKRGKIKRLELIGSKEAPKGDIDQGDSDEGQGDEDQDKGVLLSDMGVKKAVALIAETFNTELLREWQEVATRKKVISAIEKQFKAIEEARIQDTDGQGDDASVE